jgi:DNA-binding response OmpR family regulator
METANKKIMIIDDEIDLAQMMGFQFKAKGFNVLTANDGLEALAKVHEFEPDLIILDINMPRMGGIEFFSKICSSNGRSLYPVLVLTARANIQGLFQDLYIDGFMIKPFDIEHLISEAEVIIKKRSQAENKTKAHLERVTHKISIACPEQVEFDQMSALFLNADYTVIPARTGAAAIERTMRDVPDVALIHLGLEDIAGDVVIHRLSQMAKTMDVKFILFTSRTGEHDRQVLERIRAKSNVIKFIEYGNPQEVLDTVNKLFT